MTDTLRFLQDELENFKQIARVVKPSAGEVPRLEGIEISALSIPLNGEFGGDHVVFVDFNCRYDLDSRIRRAEAEGRREVAALLAQNRTRAGVLIADVAGHRLTDAMVAAMLHQAFLLGTYYELETYGEITTQLIQHIKRRFYESTNIQKLVAMLYGEIHQGGRFRYTSAGHPPPLVWSREFGRLVQLAPERRATQGLIGLSPASDVPVNEIELLGGGDILILATDGLTEHGDGAYVIDELPRFLARVQDLPAADIACQLKDSVRAFTAPSDDVTAVVFKRS
ncbi:MAG TPA: PP2C family protein-serine/threonine phosphatase [Candidatus Polarisedimenticolaceae bacterium]|nr:PP2C family protein-serine/threonine phosphatase [Candidatus Polarisedimenticolaceae bacterium]